MSVLQSEGFYQPVSQDDDESIRSNIDLDGDALAPSPPTDLPPFLVDSRVRWIHFVLGCSVLLPWNVMITATPYFLSRLAGSPLRSTFTSYMATSFTITNLLFLGHATATTKKSSPSKMIRTGILWLVFLNFLLTVSTFFVASPGVFFTFVIFVGASQAVVGSYLQTAIIAVASLFGPPAIQAMMSGQAAVAVAVSGVQVISAIASTYGKPRTFVGDGSAEERSAFAFFFLATCFLMFSAALHAWLVKMPVYQSVAAPLERPPKKSAREASVDDERRRLITGSPAIGFTSAKTSAWRILKANAFYEIAVANVFMTTLAVFPPITTSILPVNPNTHPLVFSAIHFFVFNVGDFLGRYICTFRIFLFWSGKKHFILSVARTLFIPIFLMCNIQRGGDVPGTSTPVINSDFFFMAILFCFGCSNGYISSLAMMAAPSIEHNPKLRGRIEDVDVAATLASFCLVSGLAMGSFASFAVRAMVCRCNPFMQ